MSHELYRHYNAEGVLLYVGISLGVLARTRWHRKHSSWFENVVHITIERYPTREAAREAEVAAIIEEAPLHNKNNNLFRYRPISIGELELTDVDDGMHLNIEKADIVKKLLDALTQKERRVVDLYYGLSSDGAFNLEEIGWMLGVTRQYVQMILARAEVKMRQAAANRHKLMVLPPETAKPRLPPIDLVELGLL